MKTETPFPLALRVLHWLMAALILSMLAIGFAMVTSLVDFNLLVSIHRPLGILILCLALLRLVIRFATGIPPLPQAMPAWQKHIAHASHVLLYSLMIAMPLVGWAMLSAAAYPIVLFGPLQLPPILPHDVAVYAVLRTIHTVLAYLLFATILCHACAGLLHALVFRDGVFASMTGSRHVERTDS